MKTRVAWVSGMLAVVPACGDEATPSRGAGEESPRDAQSGRICPSCRSDTAGTETSDFSGSQSSCTGEAAPAPDDATWNARVAEVRDVYAGPFEASLQWAYIGLVESDSPGAFWEGRPSGYDPITSLQGTVTLEPTQFYEGRPVLGSDATLECPDWYHVPLTVEFATDDGALSGTARGYVNVGLGPAIASADLDLAQALGTLDLHLDPDLAYRASAGLRLQFHPDGKRGQISVAVQTVERSADREGGYWPLNSSFPDDGCGANGFPSTADVALPWLEGQTAAQALQSWNAEINGSPTPALRQDCTPGNRAETPVELSFDTGVPEASICALPAWPAAGFDGRFSFVTAARLRTSDRRIDMPLVSGSATPTSLELFSDPALYPGSDPSLLIPVDQFGAESGILDVHPGTSAVLGYYSAAYFSRGDDTMYKGGSLSVMGLDCTGEGCFVPVHSAVRWPVDESATTPSCQL
jgi:hypothetical protein